MAQLGDFVRAKALLQSAARAFGPKETVARARCVVAEAEIALVSRDLNWPAKALDAARATLEERGDRLNAAHARFIEVRRLLLIGRLDEAGRKLIELDPEPFPPASRAAHDLVVAGSCDPAPRGRRRRGRTRPGRTRRTRRRHSCADGGGPKRIPGAGRARGASDCGRRGAATPARGSRGLAGVDGAGRGRVPLSGAQRRRGGLAR